MSFELPATLTGTPDQEALALGLEQIVFVPLEEDERQRQASGSTLPPLRVFALLDASQSADIPICLEGFSNPARCLFGPAPVLFRSFESDTRHQGDRIWQQYTAMSSSVMQFASRSPVA